MKINVAKIIWISGIIAILSIIFYLVVDYKVKWAYKDLNTYVYFYRCSNDLCSTTTKQNIYFSKIKCENNICPFIISKNENLLILNDSDKIYLFDYLDNKIISNEYSHYRYIGNKNYVVSKMNKYGVINNKNEILVPIQYDFITDYKDNIIAYENESGSGIISTDGLITISPIYEDAVLINKEKYALCENSKYSIYEYNDNQKIKENYDYIYAYNDILILIKDKKIDIVDENFNSLLSSRIDTYYQYESSRERSTLNIKHDEYDNLYFQVYINETESESYIFNTKNKILK